MGTPCSTSKSSAHSNVDALSDLQLPDVPEAVLDFTRDCVTNDFPLRRTLICYKTEALVLL